MELKDDQCLHDYRIMSGAKLTLVLAMRDGPVNMRRVESVDEPCMDGLELLMNEQVGGISEIFVKLFLRSVFHRNR